MIHQADTINRRAAVWLGGALSSDSWKGVILLVIPLTVLAVTAHFFFSEPTRITITYLFITLIAALGFYMFIGTSGVASFGHVAFMNIAAHLQALLTLEVATKAELLPNLPFFLANVHLGFVPALLITVVSVGVFAFLIGVPFCRMGDAGTVIVTLCFLVVIYEISLVWTDVTRGVKSIYDVPQYCGLWTAFGFAMAAILLARFFKDSVAGIRLGASAENREAAESLGVNVPNLRLLAWVISTIVMAVAGALLTHFLTLVNYDLFYLDLAFTLLAMVIIGGVATVSGAVIGAVFWTVVMELLERLGEGPAIGPVHFPEIHGLTMIGTGVVIMAVMFWKRDGITGWFEIDEHLANLKRRRAIQDRNREPSPPRKAPARETVPEPASTQRLLIEHVTKNFGGLRALNDVSLRLDQGEILGLIGPNGSGKTTLINIISGALLPTGGSITLDGLDITSWPAHRVARQGIGRTFQSIKIFPHMTVLANILAGATSPKALKYEDPIQRTNRLLLEFDLKNYAYQMAGNLPYGLQRSLEIARAMALEPSFLLIDEPAAGMVRKESDQLVETLKRLRTSFGFGLLVVDHDLPMIMKLCDRVVVLNEGRIIAEGSPYEVQHDPDVIEAYIGRKRNNIKGQRA